MARTEQNPLRQLAWSLGMLLAATLFLHGCAAQKPVGRTSSPAPVTRPAPTPAPGDTPVDASLEAPTPPITPSRESVPVPKEGKAAGTLLASARQNVRAGQFGKAEMTLERALRLEPRNARLWQEMAQVKYGQKDYGQVVQFCVKSNSLAGKDYGLIRQNWLLMEKAYLKLGKPDKARQARSRAE